jgi:DNA-binding MarR family transcriptional regulator
MEPHNKLIQVSKQFAWVFLRLQRLIDRSLSPHEASLAKIRLLAFIAEGPKRSTDIASFFGQAPRTVTQAIDALESARRIRRIPVPGDRRAKYIELTDEGRALLRQAQPLYEQLLDRTVGILEAAELSAFSALLAKVDAAVALVEKLSVDQPADPPPGG